MNRSDRSMGESRSNRVGVVSAHYYGHYLGASLPAAVRLAREARAEAFVAVSNHASVAGDLSRAVERLDLPWATTLAHDNRGSEFGAYQAGLDRLTSLDLDWVLILNDTFAIHRPFTSVHRRHLRRALSRRAEHRTPEVAGEVESYGRSFAILGLRTHRWVTTSVFALNRAALRALGGRVYRPEVDALVTGAPEPDRFFAPSMDPVLARHIAAWLLVPRDRSTWYGAAVLDVANAPRLAAKARSILQEKYLAAVLEEASTWFFEIRGSGPRDLLERRLGRCAFELRRGFTGGQPSSG